MSRAGSKKEADSIMMGFAERQHGVVARHQLRSAGVSGSVVDRRVQAGWLRVIHRGVYLLGPVLPPRALEMAAVLACGAAAAVTSRTAGRLWAIVRTPSSREPVEILTEANCHRAGILVHRVTALRGDEVTRLDGIPIAVVARTLLDLAKTADARELERALAEALARGLTTRRKVRRLLERHPGARGSRVLHALLDDDSPARTRSEAEEAFYALVREAGLPLPHVNARVEGLEVDFYWPSERLVVEIDGAAYHRSRLAFERDRRRDGTLLAAGLRVYRVTWRQLQEQRLPVLARVVQLLTHTAA